MNGGDGMDITALFDDADAAEHALVNLQALGIYPTRYKIKALHIHQSGKRAWTAFGNTAGIPGIGMGVGNGTAGGTGVAMTGMSYGGPAFGGGEPPNREVQLLVTVEEPEAHRTQSALISNHARRVRMAG
jgi:hypothetical protein